MSRLACATVTLVTETIEEDRHHWIVMFSEREKLYAYLYRTVPYMTEVVRKFYSEHARWPYRMWVIVDGEIQKVEISS